MKKIVGLAVMLVMSAVISAHAAGGATPVKLSLIPNVGIPENQVVHGLDIGILGSKVQEVQGVQLAWFYGATESKMVGVQDAFVTSSNKVVGLQWGFVNLAQDVTGVQVGFVNITEQMRGVQVGLVNVIKQGVLPAMVFVNANF